MYLVKCYEAVWTLLNLTFEVTILYRLKRLKPVGNMQVMRINVCVCDDNLCWCSFFFGVVMRVILFIHIDECKGIHRCYADVHITT